MTRRRRLKEGRCPTHGLPLVQVMVLQEGGGDPYGEVAECPRKKCPVVATNVEDRGWTLSDRRKSVRFSEPQ